ncbi:MAG: cobalamin-dependent protein [archaeon]
MKLVLITTDCVDIGARTISAYLKNKGYETKIISMSPPSNISNFMYDNTNIKKYSSTALKNLLNLVKDSDVIGISSTGVSTPKALQLIKALKKLNKPIIWGGIFATTFPEFCIKHADIVCIGEGELALEELLKKIELGKNYYKTKNFWFKKGNKIIKNPVRPLFADLDKLPNYDYSPRTNYVLEKNKTFKKLSQKHIGNWLFYRGIRGCPFSCTYCSNCLLKRLYKNKGIYIRKRSIKLVIQDLEQLKKQFPKLQWIWIIEDDINIRTIEELKEFRELYRKKIKLPFEVYMTPATVNEEKLKLLLEAGLIKISLGIQSASDRVNKEVYGRPITKQQTLKAIQLINKYKEDIEPLIYEIIINNPYETKEDILQTINFLLEIPKPYCLYVYSLVFDPGMPLYYKALKNNLLNIKILGKDNINLSEVYSNFRIKKNNLYLNCILYLMKGKSTQKKYGALPGFMIKYLLNPNLINEIQKHHKLLLNIDKIYAFISQNITFVKSKILIQKAKILGQIIAKN